MSAPAAALTPAAARRRRRGGARAIGGAAIVLAWLAGLGVLARREYGRGPAERLAQAALRVSPGATYFAVDQGGTQVGFASSTIDTVPDGIEVTDFFVADLPAGGRLHRASARLEVRLSRALALRDFDLRLQTESGPVRVAGAPSGDTLLTYFVQAGDAAPDTQRVRLGGPLLLPSVVPLAVALGEPPEVGNTYDVTMFDPTALAPRAVKLAVRAESTFLVPDSARFDGRARRWQVAQIDTVRAWRLESADGSGGLEGWVDAQGRFVQVVQPGSLAMRRMAYELAYDNWRIARRESDSAGVAVGKDDDVVERTAIAADASTGGRSIERLRVRVSGVALRGFDLEGAGQRFRGDELVVQRAAPRALAAAYTLPAPREVRRANREFLGPEPLLEVGHPEVRALAARIAGGERNPRVAAERLVRWVHDSLRKDITVGVPSALQVLRSRTGDCNEHAQLYVALARSLGIPARTAAGLAYVKGKFYYHAWPEVLLGDWTAVDPTFGEFPADAGHLRFVAGSLTRQAELLRLIGRLRLDVVEAR